MRFVVGIVLLAATLCYAQAAEVGKPRPRAASRLHLSRLQETEAIMHCLTAYHLNWIGDALPAIEKRRLFHVGLRHDRRTYPGEDTVFLVVFKNRLQGDVFELTLSGSGAHRLYNLENNGSYRFGGKETGWPNEIFGGIWTHEYFERNIRAIRRGPKVWVRLKSVTQPVPGISCDYYGQDENKKR